jgi:hypothetical protein
MVGYFRTPSFYFLLDNVDSTLKGVTSKAFDDQSFDDRLTGSGSLPDRNGAPLGSWVIARLAHLTNGRVGPIDGETLYVDGGDFCLDLLVYDETMSPIATLQIQGGDSIAIFGECHGDVNHAAVLDEFAAALVADPKVVRPFRININDPEDRSSRRYGYDGGRYLR